MSTPAELLAELAVSEARPITDRLRNPGPHSPVKLRADALAAIESLQAQVEVLLGCLGRSVTLIDDLLNIHVAQEFCADDRIAEAKRNITAAGGSLAYIADVQQTNRTALNQAGTREVGP